MEFFLLERSIKGSLTPHILNIRNWKGTLMTSLLVKAIDHMVLNVNEVEISAEWYSKVLGMKRERIEKKNVLSFGKQMIKLRPKDTTQAEWFTAK